MTRPNEAVFAAQLRFLEHYAPLRSERSSEILAQLPGPMAFLSSIGFMRPGRVRWTLELLGLTLRLARHGVNRFKHALACRRPIEFSPQIQPMILTPGHGTLPSGHATEAFAVARVLRDVMRAQGTLPYTDPRYEVQLLRLATRIAVNRTVAGVHFPVDSIAGAVLGSALGHYLVRRASSDVDISFAGLDFDGAAEASGLENQDFAVDELFDVQTGQQKFDAPFLNKLEAFPMRVAQRPSLVNWLWNKAKEEWA